MKGILPYFKDTDGNRWEVLSMNWCIDFGGRQCQVKCQRNNDDNTFPSKTFVIFGTGTFAQYNYYEVASCTPEADTQFYKSVMQMFRDFDEVQDPDFPVGGG